MLDKKGYVDNLRKLYAAHEFYYNATEGDKARLFDACERLFDKVEAGYSDIGPGASVGGSSHDSGLDRSFGVLLLLFGKFFLKEQFDCDSLDQFVENFTE